MRNRILSASICNIRVSEEQIFVPARGSLLPEKRGIGRKKTVEIMKVWGPIGFFLKHFLPLLICINDTESVADITSQIKAVKDKILQGYDKDIRPMKEGSNITEVDTGLMPRQILEVDEDRNLFILDSFFYMHWEDSRLKWDESEYKGFIQLPHDLLWKPDIAVYNSHSSQVHADEEVLLLVINTGSVVWIPPFHTQTSCPGLLDVTYPYDKVKCEVIMGTWVHHGWEIDFGHGENLYMHNFENVNPRWELIIDESKVVRNVTTYEGYEEPYISIHGIFVMKRRTPPEIAATRNPCILIMLLTLSIFWLPTNSSKKVTLGGILFLALIILLVYVAWSTRFPMGAVLAVSFLQSTMYIVVTTLLLQILVIFNLCSITGPVRPPSAMMQLLTGPLGKYACLRTSFGRDNIPIDRLQLKEDTPNCIESPSPNEDWKLFAAGLDRLFFFLMAIAMIAVHHL